MPHLRPKSNQDTSMDRTTNKSQDNIHNKSTKKKNHKRSKYNRNSNTSDNEYIPNSKHDSNNCNNNNNNNHNNNSRYGNPANKQTYIELTDFIRTLDTPTSWWCGLTEKERYEWLVDCYRMRVDDDATWGEGFMHGMILRSVP